MNEVPPEVWITGQFISFASALTCLAGAGGVHGVADQQDRVLGLADQLGGLGDHLRVGALVDQAIARSAAAARARRALRG